MINEKNYYGCALDLPSDDDRLLKYKEQRKEHGFDDTETWNLNMSMAKFMSPRLKRLLEIQEGLIKEPYKGYFSEVRELAEAFDSYGEDSWNTEALETITKKFGKVFPYLWW